jgi:uncharacterized protein (TIGR03437 family)
MKVRWRMLGNVDYGRIIAPDGSITPLNDEGNGVFSTTITVPQTAGAHDVNTIHLGEVRGYVGPDEKCFNNGVITVMTDQTPVAHITSLAADAQVSDYVVNIAVPSAQLPDLNALNFSFDPTYIAKRFYQLFGDDYDMLNFVFVPGFYENRHHFIVKNTIQGIGAPIVDSTASLGSKGRLMGYNVFPLFFFYDGSARGDVHEVGHQWSAHYDKGLFNVQPHWPISSLAAGIMATGEAVGAQGIEFPCQIVKNPSGQVVTTPGLLPNFTDLDLYNMGVIPPSAVGEHYIITDQTLATALPNACGTRTLSPSQYSTLHVSDLVSTYGARVPAATMSTMKLRIATILITRDTLADSDTMSVADFYTRRFEEAAPVPTHEGIIRRLGTPMYAATNQAVTLQTQMSSRVLPSIFAGGIVDAGAFTAGKLLAPGTASALFGSNLAAVPTTASTVPLTTTLGGVQLLINGKAAPLYYVDSGVIVFQVPWEVNTAQESYADEVGLTFPPMFTALVQRGDQWSNVAYVTTQKDSPSVKIYGDNYAVVQDAQFNVIGPSNAAKPGTNAVLYLVGVSSLSEPQANGAPAPLDHFVTINVPYNLVIGGVQAKVGFAGLTPTGVGLMQMNFTVPTLPPGIYDLKVFINGFPSNISKFVIGN